MLDFRPPRQRTASTTSWERLAMVALVLAVALPVIVLVRLYRFSRSEAPSAPAPQGAKLVEPLPSELQVDPAALEVIRDNTLDRPEENGVLIRLLEILRQASPEQLHRASIGRVTYAQLQRQPNQYRGKVVTVSGTVHAAIRLTAPKNASGIDAYWQVWIEPSDAPTWPVVAECLELPSGFPTGRGLSEEATVTGFFFKRWAYLAKDQLRTAPTLLARGIQWQGSSPPAARGARWNATSLVLVGAGVAVIGLWLLVRFHRRPPRAPGDEGQRPDFSALSGAVLLSVAACVGSARAEPAATGRQLLEQYGIEPAQLDGLADGRPLSDEETLTLLRVLYRAGGRPAEGKEAFAIATFPRVDAERLARPLSKLDLGKGARGEVFKFRGRVVEVEPVRMAAALAERFDFAGYYRCRLLLESGEPAVVYARDVPEAWREGAKPNEPGGALAAYLKTLPEGQGPMFAAGRLAWYPDTPLGRLGMDVGLLEDLRDRKALVPAEKEAFYQMLAAVSRAAPGELLRLAGKGQPTSVVPLFNAPWTQRGRLVALEGIARRAVKIFIDDPEIVARFGLDHYYEIGLFTGDSQDNPLVICAPELPSGMPPGEDFRYTEEIRVAGFFCKVWAYRSARVEGGKPVAQLAPLVIAQTPVWLPAAERRTGPARSGRSAYLLIAGIVLAGWLAWRGERSWRRRRRNGVQPASDASPPDFSQLG